MQKSRQPGLYIMFGQNKTKVIMNYLQLHDNGKLGVDERKLADYFGEGNYTTFYKKHLLQNRIKLTNDDFIAGEIPVIFNAIKKLGIDYKHEDYPKTLEKVYSS